MENKRFLVKGKTFEIIYAENEEKAREEYKKICETLNRKEDYTKIIIEEKPYK